MSQENVEIVRAAIEAFNRRDLRALAEFSHHDLEFISVLTAVDAGGATYRGSEAWASYFEAMDETKTGGPPKPGRVSHSHKAALLPGLDRECGSTPKQECGNGDASAEASPGELGARSGVRSRFERLRGGG